MDRFYLVCTFLLAAVLGLCVGSFLNVLIYRLPRGMNIAKPGSHCTVCREPIRWYDNIPVISYLVLRGKCRHCGTKISPRYMIVELLNCLFWVACVWRFYAYGWGVLIVCSITVSMLLTAFFTDLEHMMIPDSVNGIIGLCAIAAFILQICGIGTEVSWQDRFWGLLAGGGSFLLIYFIVLLVIRREGLGLGDVKLMTGVGLLLGWRSTVLAIAFACILASFYALAKKAGRGKREEKSLKTDEETAEEKERKNEFPFAPFLTTAAAVCLFFGEQICTAYTNLFL